MSAGSRLAQRVGEQESSGGEYLLRLRHPRTFPAGVDTVCVALLRSPLAACSNKLETVGGVVLDKNRKLASIRGWGKLRDVKGTVDIYRHFKLRFAARPTQPRVLLWATFFFVPPC